MVKSESKQNDWCIWPQCRRLQHGLVPMATGWHRVPARHLNTGQYYIQIWRHWIFVFEISRIFDSTFDLNEISNSSHPYVGDNFITVVVLTLALLKQCYDNQHSYTWHECSECGWTCMANLLKCDIRCVDCT